MFSNITKYGFRAVIYIGLHGSKESKLEAKKIAEKLDIPAPFLAKILQTLSRNSIVCSVKGPGGGFYISDKNKGISIMEMITCLEGKDIFKTCVLGLPECGNANPCPMHYEIAKYREGLSEFILSSTIGNLVQDVKDGKVGDKL